MSLLLNIAAFFDEKAAWSKRTFGPGPRTDGVLAHIRKELTEIEREPTDLEEWVDVVLLAMDGAMRSAGADGEEFAAALAAKHAKNLARKWPDWRTAGTGPIEHVREDAADALLAAAVAQADAVRAEERQRFAANWGRVAKCSACGFTCGALAIGAACRTKRCIGTMREHGYSAPPAEKAPAGDVCPEGYTRGEGWCRCDEPAPPAPASAPVEVGQVRLAPADWTRGCPLSWCVREERARVEVTGRLYGSGDRWWVVRVGEMPDATVADGVLATWPLVSGDEVSRG